MTDIRYDVVAIGNAIVDIIGRCDDAFLAKHGAPKGHMRLVDAPTIDTLYSGMGPAIEISGGSAANTMVGVASFGGKAAFIGKVAGDEFGRIFRHDIGAAGVRFDSKAVDGRAPTSRSLILVTPDGERTMNTFLGISTELDHGEVDPELIRQSGIVYLEGYLFDRPEAKAAFRQAADVAKTSGRRVALTLSDGFCVDRHREDFLALVDDGIDILFANEDEITKLYGTESFDDGVAEVRGRCEIAAVTRGAAGSVIVVGDETIEVAAQPVARLVDTTGAGDLYAAGFLFGLTAGRPLPDCGRLGSLAASAVIGHMGPRPGLSLAQVIEAAP
jgi:sugar/nucleoside kinase (ribokinase family)